MPKLALQQLLQHKLSPQQIQFIKLLQVPASELERRVKEELEVNPVLEEGVTSSREDDAGGADDTGVGKEVDVGIYTQSEGYTSGYKTGRTGSYGDKGDIPVLTPVSLHEKLTTQLGFLGLTETQHAIGEQLIGSIEEDGYIRRDLESIVNDLALSKGLETTVEEVEKVLTQIQTFDPAGIAARDLRECLLLQLQRLGAPRDKKNVEIAKNILSRCHEEFFKKHYAKAAKKLGLADESELKGAIDLIVRLNPKPGGGSGGGMLHSQPLIPDFILTYQNGRLELTLNARNAPELKISRSYSEMFNAYEKSDKKDKRLKDTVSFMKQKLDSAKWFIDAIQQRQHTLLKTMKAIVDFQYDYFLEGDEKKLKPMILKDIAQKIDMDISMVSRVVNSKSIQTHFGIFPLKRFFSEGIATNSGVEVSNREVKGVILELVEKEAKDAPLSDEKLERLLRDRGYRIARRTVAKYREQLHIPVARLRKKLL